MNMKEAITYFSFFYLLPVLLCYIFIQFLLFSFTSSILQHIQHGIFREAAGDGVGHSEETCTFIAKYGEYQQDAYTGPEKDGSASLCVYVLPLGTPTGA